MFYAIISATKRGGVSIDSRSFLVWPVAGCSRLDRISFSRVSQNKHILLEAGSSPVALPHKSSGDLPDDLPPLRKAERSSAAPAF